MYGWPMPFPTSRIQPTRSNAAEKALRTLISSNGFRCMLNATPPVTAAGKRTNCVFNAGSEVIVPRFSGATLVYMSTSPFLNASKVAVWSLL